jgi:hypothetical protein
VNEHVVAAIIGSDESKTLLVVVEFYGSAGHDICFLAIVMHMSCRPPLRLLLLANAEFW